jgi:hypothetical protein
MEQHTEQLIQKLVTILRRMARTARHNQWMGASEEADQYSVDQFNRILERFKAVDSSGAHEVFAPLPAGSSWTSLSSACQDVIACYEPESAEGQKRQWRGFCNETPHGIWTDAKSGIWIDKEAFEQGLPRKMQEFGDFLRDQIHDWQRRSKHKPEER